ncbi:MAG: hypothetical protein ACYTGZ_04250 [Planctomycetota bacterium]|jgi:hypothetical protein
MRTAILLLLISIPALASDPFAKIRAELPHRTPTGAYTGSIKWGSDRADARLETLNGTTMLAVRPPLRRLIDLTQGLTTGPLSELDISDPVIVFCPNEMSVTLSTEAAKYYDMKRLSLKRGVNLFARVRARPGSLVTKLLKTQGLTIDGLILQGVILRDFNAIALDKAKQEGKLKEALRKGTMLYVRLPEFEMKGLPAGFKQGSAYFYVTGEPGFGVGFTLARGVQEFSAELGVRKTDKGATEVMVFASAIGRWKNAFGIDGFHVDDARLLIAMDNTQNGSIGVRGQMVLGSKEVLMAGKITVHAVTGAPTAIMLEGALNELSSADLVAVANSTRGRARALDAKALPDFRLQDVYLRYAPLGGDAKLGIDSGLALKGRLIAFKKRLGYVDGVLDQQTKPATIRLHGNVADFSAGPVALKDAAVAINLGPTANPYFRVKGASRVWVTKKAIDIDISRKRFYWSVEESVGGVYAAHHKYRSANGGRYWHGDIWFRNDLSRKLERDVSRSATAWADRKQRDYGKAEADLNRAIARVKELDRRIDAARRKVEAERAKATRNLRAAEAEVKRLDGLIAKRKSALYDAQVKLYKSYQWHKSNTSKKYKAWKKAIKATKKAPVWDKPKYKAREARAYAAYKKAKAARDVARARYEAARRKIDPQLQSLQAARGTAVGALKAARVTYAKVTGGVPVDADARVAALIAQRGTAIAALKTARAAVNATGDVVVGAGRVTAWAAKNNGKLLMIDEARFEGGLGKSLSATGGSLRMKVRWMGERRTVIIKCSLEDIRRGIHERVWRALKRPADL